MKKLSHFCTHARALLACYLDMTPEQQRLARAYIQDKALPEVQALRNAAGTPGGALAADLLQNCNILATANSNVHFLHIARACRAHLANTHFLWIFPLKAVHEWGLTTTTISFIIWL